MKPSIKQKWVKALRSGAYKQGTGALNDKQNRFCCLGVLADISGCTWKKVHPDDGDNFPYIDGQPIAQKDRLASVGSFSYNNFLSSEFCRSVGMSPKTQKQLANMNDGGGKFLGNRQDFEQIANHIERYM